MEIDCVAHRFVYKHPDSDWAVLVAIHDNEEIRLVGGLQDVSIGEHLQAVGSWRVDPKHGKSFKIESVTTTRPRTLVGIQAYLVGHMHGVGPSLAGKIVNYFGDQTLDIIDRDPRRLLEVPGFGASKLDRAIEHWHSQNATREIIIHLQEFGASKNLARKIYRAWGEETIPRLDANPYDLVEIDGIGFIKADEIAQGMGIAINDHRRIEAGIVHVLFEAGGKGGHVYLPLSDLIEQSRAILSLDERAEAVAERIQVAAQAGRLVLEPSVHGERHVYLPSNWKKEVRLAMKLRSLSERSGLFHAPPAPPDEDFQTTERQWMAVQVALQHRVSVLTGSPGTGKCVVGGTHVYANGDYCQIGDLWNRAGEKTIFDGEGYWKSLHVTTRSVNEQGEIVDGEALRIYRQEVDEIGRMVTLTSGHHITMTQAHKLKSKDGWTKDLHVNMEVEYIEKGIITYAHIVAIEPVTLHGPVYDLEVSHYHNYCANDIVTHNTTACKVLCDTMDSMGLRIQLCAPTGKAAKRITEATGHQAATVHRMLGWQPFGGYERNANNPLECEVLVIDEASMLDLPLADSLFEAVGDHTHVVLVGDVDQLEPVGIGRVLEDIIRSNRIPVTRLVEIFRQARRSMIIQAAYKVNSGQIPDDDPEAAQHNLEEGDEVLHDYFWIPRQDNDEIAKLVVEYATERIPSKFGLNPRDEIQVIAPQKNTVVGVDALNVALQKELNPDGAELSPTSGYRVGDKLLNTQNNYTHDIMNGEFASILSYNKHTGLVELGVDERVIDIGIQDVESSFVLAYATTVHKMQGSSAKAVVLPMSMSYSRMLSRQLLYTAITRAEDLCMVIGMPQALGYAVAENNKRPRYSSLAERLQHPSMSGQLL